MGAMAENNKCCDYIGATVQACNRTLKAQPKAAVERKKSIRVQLQEIKEKHGTRN